MLSCHHQSTTTTTILKKTIVTAHFTYEWRPTYLFQIYPYPCPLSKILHSLQETAVNDNFNKGLCFLPRLFLVKIAGGCITNNCLVVVSSLSCIFNHDSCDRFSSNFTLDFCEWNHFFCPFSTQHPMLKFISWRGKTALLRRRLRLPDGP